MFCPTTSTISIFWNFCCCSTKPFYEVRWTHITCKVLYYFQALYQNHLITHMYFYFSEILPIGLFNLYWKIRLSILFELHERFMYNVFKKQVEIVKIYLKHDIKSLVSLNKILTWCFFWSKNTKVLGLFWFWKNKYEHL